MQAPRKIMLIMTLIILALVVIIAPGASADPLLPLPRIPICGDEDGSETPFIFLCPDFVRAKDVQTYRVLGEGFVELRFDFVFREAGYNNELGVFIVDDQYGMIEALIPGDAGYFAAAWDRAQVIFPSGSNAYSPDVSLTFEAGDILVFFIVQNNSFEALLANNPSNEIGDLPLAFFSLDTLNPDGTDHFVGFQSTEEPFTQFGFEDLTGGGDLDYDDIVYNIRPPLEPIPPILEPVILLPGMGGSEITTTDTIDLSVDNGHGGIWEHTYPSDEIVWMNVEALVIGDDDYFDVLKFEPDGLTPVTSKLTPSRIFKWLAIFRFYNRWEPFFVSQGYELGVTLFEFPYNFRQDISKTADELDDLVLDALVAANGGETDPNRWTVDRVNLVGHSMGTIVSREYASNPERAQRVHRIIALGPAYMGAPKLLKAILFGDDMGTMGLLNPQEVKDLAQNWPGAFEVGPSRLYWKFYDGSTSALLVPFREDRDFDVDGNPPPDSPGINLSYDQTRALLENVGTNMALLTMAEQFHDRLDTSWDSGLPVPEVHIVAGTNICSPGQLRAYWRLFKIQDKPPKLVPAVELRHVNGDGTVPLFSATLEDASRGLDYNGTAEVYYAPDIKHGDALSNNDLSNSSTVLDLIASILQGDTVIPDGITQTQTGSCGGKIVSVQSPVELHVYDSSDNHTGPTLLPEVFDGQRYAETGIPGSMYEELMDAKYVNLPEDGVYTIRLISEGEGTFDLRIRDYEGNQVESMILFLHAPLTASTVGEMIFDSTAMEAPVLRLDFDADGTIDDEISATSVLGPGEASDVQAPTIEILSPADGATVVAGELIVWNVEDDLSGVLNEFGVVDGESYVENGSTLPFGAGEHTLAVFAEDRRGTAAMQESRFVVYPFEWLQPVSTSDPYEAKAGRTIPVKFRVEDLEGNPVEDESVQLSLMDEEGNLVAGPFMFDPNPVGGVAILGDGMYHHNLRTDELAEGAYRLQVSFNSEQLAGVVQRALVLR